MLEETNIDVLAITETHLSPEVTDIQIKIQNYSIVRKDRSGRNNHYGGVLIYHKNSIDMYDTNFEIKQKSLTETLWVEMNIKSQKLLIGTIYRPPKDKNFIKAFATVLEKISHRKNLILLGDFNIDLSNENAPLVAPMKQTLQTFNLTNTIKYPTRITATSSTQIDLAIVTDPSKVINCGSFDSCLSDHNIIFVTYKLFFKRKPPKIITVRNYKNINMQELSKDLQSSPWQLLDIFDDVDMYCGAGRVFSKTQFQIT